jgi:N-methylhydantoinase A
MRIAGALQISLEAAALGIVTLANEHMAQALRVISVQRGIDPRPFRLVSFGGAGGLHVCALADALGMRRALVPVHAGVLSALGMLAAPRARQLSHTLTGVLADFDESLLQEQLSVLADKGREELLAEGIRQQAIKTGFSLDLRYQGQSFTLTLPWQDLEQAPEAFHVAHEQRYGHRLSIPVELVNIRCNLYSQPPAITLPAVGVRTSDKNTPQYAQLAGYGDAVPVWSREHLYQEQVIVGPALITETVATTYLSADWNCRVDRVGNLFISHV